MITKRQTIAVFVAFVITFLLYVVIGNVTPLTRLAMGTDASDSSFDYAALAGIAIASVCGFFYLSYRNKTRDLDDMAKQGE